MKRVVDRILPDGIVHRVQPFHVCLKGLEDAIICQDEEDYDIMVKIVFICSLRKNVSVIIYNVVSNHFHAGVLAIKLKDAKEFGYEIKRMYSMWAHRKHNSNGLMEGIEVTALSLSNDWHVRNALAYIPRNALDNGVNIQEYKWSGYRAMFSKEHIKPEWKKAKNLTRREKERIFHTREDLSKTEWMIDEKEELVPSSACDSSYLEQAFNNDQAFFLRTIGCLNITGLRYELEEAPRKMLPDGEFLKLVNEASLRWFNTESQNLSLERKSRLIPYIYHIQKTTIPQLARTFSLRRETIESFLNTKS